MINGIEKRLLSVFRDYLAAQMGLYFPIERWRDLELGISAAARDFCYEDTESCIRWLMSSPLTKNQVEILASHLTIGETYFFRDKRSFEILEETILRGLIQSRRGAEQHLRIWSAGCSTGEEPYSIAILVNKMVPDIKSWNVTILATDINPRFIRQAMEGVYGEWSFRDTPVWVKEKYFERTKEGRFKILPCIKEMVKFTYLNLAEDAYPSYLSNINRMDLIFCRNVLIYFAPEQKKNIIQNFYRALAEGGWFVVSPAETSQVLFSQFFTVNYTGAIFYKKDQEKTPQTQDFGATAPFSVPRKAADEPVRKFKPGEFMIVQTDFFGDNTAQNPSISAEQQEAQKPQRTPYEQALALYEQASYGEAAATLAGVFLNNTVRCSEPRTDGLMMALLGRAYANQGKLDEALEWCEKAIAADKINPGFQYLLATVLQEKGLVEEAMNGFKRALYLDQNFVLAHFALGNLTRQQGALKESDKHFQNALLFLRDYDREDVLPESDGITAGRLSVIMSMMKGRNKLE